MVFIKNCQWWNAIRKLPYFFPNQDKEILVREDNKICPVIDTAQS